jgi:hypothetical protein
MPRPEPLRAPGSRIAASPLLAVLTVAVAGCALPIAGAEAGIVPLAR